MSTFHGMSSRPLAPADVVGVQRQGLPRVVQPLPQGLGDARVALRHLPMGLIDLGRTVKWIQMVPPNLFRSVHNLCSHFPLASADCNLPVSLFTLAAVDSATRSLQRWRCLLGGAVEAVLPLAGTVALE